MMPGLTRASRSGALTTDEGHAVMEGSSMARLALLRIPTRRARRSLVSGLASAVLALSFVAGPVGATVVVHDNYSDDYAFSIDDCGFWIDVSGHDEGRFQIRAGKGDLATAFFAHDNYSFVETWTRRDTGEFFTLSGNGLFHETKATHVEGTIFEFTSINSGQPFVVRDSDGNLVMRDRGVIRESSSSTPWATTCRAVNSSPACPSR